MKGLRKQYSFGAKTGLDTQNLGDAANLLI